MPCGVTHDKLDSDVVDHQVDTVNSFPTVFVAYYETIKSELNKRLIYECRCDTRLKTKAEGLYHCRTQSELGRIVPHPSHLRPPMIRVYLTKAQRRPTEI